MAAPGAAAAIVGAFGDPGLAYAQTLTSIPVVGLGEAGMREAGKGGRPFSIVTVGAAMHNSIVCRAEGLGQEGQLVEILMLSCSVPGLGRNRARVVTKFWPRFVHARARPYLWRGSLRRACIMYR